MRTSMTDTEKEWKTKQPEETVQQGETGQQARQKMTVPTQTEQEKTVQRQEMPQQKSAGASGKGSPRERRPMEKSVFIVFLVILLILAAAAAGGAYCIWQITHIAEEGAGVILFSQAFGR